MGNFRIRVPDSVWGGWYWRRGKVSLGLLAHALQCGQRWIVLLRVGKRRLGYRTHGDATPDMDTYDSAGFYWPWKRRTLPSGRN